MSKSFLYISHSFRIHSWVWLKEKSIKNGTGILPKNCVCEQPSGWIHTAYFCIGIRKRTYTVPLFSMGIRIAVYIVHFSAYFYRCRFQICVAQQNICSCQLFMCYSCWIRMKNVFILAPIDSGTPRPKSR